MRQFIPRVVLALLLAAATTAEAQSGVDPTTLSLEDLMATPVERVYGASKFQQKVSDAPAAVTIVTAEEIRLHGYRTLADILRSVEGISVSYDRNYSYLGLRGLSRPGDLNSRVLVLVDGHRMNNNVDDQANLGTDFQLDVDLIDRVEVIRGPSAALYGSTAFVAVVAVVTRTGAKIDGFEGAMSVAGQDTTRLRGTWGRRSPSGLEVLVSASRHRSGGASQLFFPEFADAPTGGVVQHGDGDGAHSVAASVSFGGLAVQVLHGERSKKVPTASFNTVFNSGREQTVDRRTTADVQFTREFGQSTVMLARVYADRYAYDGYYPYASEAAEAVEPLVINRDRFRGAWWGGELNVSRRLWRAHTLTAGTEFRRNVEQSTRNYDEAPAAVYLDQRPQTHALALSVQDEFLAHRAVRVNVAARLERLPTGETGFGPKVGVILAPAAATSIKLLFSRAMRAPSIYELYYDSPANAGNTLLRAERMDSLEINAEHYFTPAMKIEASLFRNVYRALIVEDVDADGLVTLRNGLDARAPGAELSWAVKRRDGVQARASYATLFDADEASRAWTSGAPKHLAKISGGLATTPIGLSLAGELQYESRRRTHTGEVLDPVVVANLNVVRPGLLRGVDLHASVLNLFDVRYSEPVSENHRQGSVTQDGRQFVVGLTWRFK